jgi:hypothetical protein
VQIVATLTKSVPGTLGIKKTRISQYSASRQSSVEIPFSLSYLRVVSYR